MARYDDLIARNLACEAQTMQVLKRETTIPVPEILKFDKSLDNKINCPYILRNMPMVWPSRIAGVIVAWPVICSNSIGVTALKQRAVIMIQLDKFTYTKGGQLVYCEDGKSTISGALLETDCELGPFED